MPTDISWRRDGDPIFPDFVPLPFFSRKNMSPTPGGRFIPKRLELIPKDMTQKDGRVCRLDPDHLAALHGTNPEQKRGLFVSDLIDAYLGEFPMDKVGLVHTGMVRLEVER